MYNIVYCKKANMYEYEYEYFYFGYINMGTIYF